MKIREILITVMGASLLVAGSLTLTAQSAEEASSGEDPAPALREGRGGEGIGRRGGKFRKKMMMKRIANQALTEEEQEILKNAREAVKNDPEVQAAREEAKGDPEKRAEFRDLFQEKMIQQHPLMESIFQKIGEAAKEAREHREAKNEQRRERREALGQLTPEERKAFFEARKEVKDDPQVQAARENLRDTVRAAMLQVNPDLEPVLDKLPQPGE